MSDKVFVVTFCEYDICMQNRVFRTMEKLLAELEKAIKVYSLFDLFDEESGEMFTVDSLLESGLIDIEMVRIEE